MKLEYKLEFLEPMMSGTKIHTIRRDKNRNFRKGLELEFYIPNTDLILEKETCTGTQRIFMSMYPDEFIEVSIDGSQITELTELNRLAVNSGFKTWPQFCDYFEPKLLKEEDNCYSAIIIHWTDFRY